MKRRLLSVVIASTVVFGSLFGAVDYSSYAATNQLPSGDESGTGGGTGGGSDSPFDFQPSQSTIKDGETNVPLDSLLMFKFDKAVGHPDVLSKNAEKIKVTDENNKSVSFTVTAVPDSVATPSTYPDRDTFINNYRRYLSVNIAGGLKENKTYKIVLGKGIAARNGSDITTRDYTITFSTIKKEEPTPTPNPNPTPTPTPKPDETPGSDSDSKLPSFTDIDKHWAKEYINRTVQRGLFKGTSETLFSPDVEMNRGMFVTVLGRLSNEKSTFIDKFSDVEEGAYYSNYVTWAEKNGIVKGYDDGSFKPDQNINREEMAAMIYRYIQYKDIVIDNKAVITFSDMNEVSDWASDSVEKLQRSEIINGKVNNSFIPQDFTTRAEVATVLDRLVTGYIN